MSRTRDELTYTYNSARRKMPGPQPIQQIRAIVHIQWLSFRNSLRRRSERVGLALTLLVAVVWYGLWTAGAAALFFFTALAGQERLERTLAGILFFLMLYWQLSPLLTASMGMAVDLRKMALYPIGAPALFGVECILRLLTGAETVLLLGGVALGLTARAPGRALVFLPAFLLFLAMNVLASAGLRHVLERLLQRRGMKELFVFLLVMGSALPQLVFWSGSAERLGQRVLEWFGSLPQWLLPSTAVARASLGTSRAGDWLALAAWLAAAAWFGYSQFRRSFRYDFAAARSQASGLGERPSLADRLYRLPSRLLPDPLGALAEKEIRYYARSPRFRFLFLMGCSFGIVAWVPLLLRRGASPDGLQSSFLTVLSLYSLLLLGQITFLNSFGLDRSAARYFFWLPVGASRILLAKNLAAVLFLLVEVLVLGGICAVLRVVVTPWQVVEALAVALIASLYVASAGNFASVMFATGLSPERVSRGGAGRGIQGLLAFLYPVLISPILAAYLARYYWDSVKGFLLLLAMAAAGGVALYGVTLPLAARLGWQRRERLLQDLSRGEGPVVSE